MRSVLLAWGLTMVGFGARAQLPDSQPASVADQAQTLCRKEAQLSELRRRQIADLRQLLRDHPHHEKKAELLFRLAEKEWAEADHQFSLDQGECSP